MRQIVIFPCSGDTLVGTLDRADGAVGLLIVSGGNEIRSGAHRGMTVLAEALAVGNVPVFRFDRRGVGDSSGTNTGWETSAPDITAAIAAFRVAQPQMTRIAGFGNCDAATALALHDNGLDVVILANPWLGVDDAPPPPAAIRARYLARLRRPASWASGVDIRKLFNGLQTMFRLTSEQPLAARIAASIARTPTTLILATGDRTAQIFAADTTFANVPTVAIATTSHSFADAGDDLAAAILTAIRQLP